MKLYDNDIKNLLAELNNYNADFRDSVELAADEYNWKLYDKEQLILRSDMAYELGGDGLEAVSGIAFTFDSEIVPDIGVSVIGPQLADIKEDCDYARITLIRLKKDIVSDDVDALYRVLRKIDYVRYHIFPEGYMMRISSVKEREPVRIGKNALDKGIDFFKIGRGFNDMYMSNQEVEAVQTIFLTKPQADYRKIAFYTHRFEQITDSLNHIFEGVKMDCSVCNLKSVCDEVEGLKELHFKREKNGD